MKIKHGLKVIDKDEKVLGKVDYIVCNHQTGDVTKFMVWRESPKKDLFLTPDDVDITTESKIKLNVDIDKLNQKMNEIKYDRT